jgi:hypothetical protein
MQGHLKAMGAKAAHHAAQNGIASDSDADRLKITILPPMRLDIGRRGRLVSQVACGLQHTGRHRILVILLGIQLIPFF